MMKFNFTTCLNYGAAQDLLGVMPDLTAFGKIVAVVYQLEAMVDVSVYGTSRHLLGPAYQTGTMAGNPLSMKAGIALLEVSTIL